MAGLLGDNWDDPRTIATLQMAAGLLGGGNFGQAAGRGLADYQRSMTVAREQERRQQELAMREAEQKQQMQVRAMQMQAAQQEAARRQGVEGAYRDAFESPATQALAGGQGPTPGAAQAMQGMQPRINQEKLIQGLMRHDPMAAAQMLQPKPDDYKVVGDSLVSIGGGGVKEAYRAPQKQAEAPGAVREYEYARQQGYGGSFERWKNDNARAGASSVSVNTSKPLLNTIAEGLGKNIDASLSAAQSAVPAIQTAQTLKSAVDTGKLIAGPGSTFRVLGLQVGQMLGVGGKDGAEVLANTRTTIQSMAKAELEAAQQMRGQGQITEAERNIIKRASSGDIDSLTAPEIRILADSMEKTARFKIQTHKANVKRLGTMEGAAPLIPFYDMDEPAPYSGGASKVKRYNPATGRIE